MRFLQTILILFVNRIDCIYKGKFIGALEETSKDIKGDVYAADEDIIFIDKFYYYRSYVGAPPETYFRGGTMKKPDVNDFIIPDLSGMVLKLKKWYQNEPFLRRMPKGKKLKDIRHVSIWEKELDYALAFVLIIPEFKFPRELQLGPLNTFSNSIKADNVILKNIREIQLKGFHFDGSSPGMFFIAGTGDKPNSGGTRIPDENGNHIPLKPYTGQDITIRMPKNISVFTIDWFSVYNFAIDADFGSVKIHKDDLKFIPADPQDLGADVNTFGNCETVFDELLEVSWEMREKDIYFKLDSKYNAGRYIAFGLSGSQETNQMIGADVAVAFLDMKTSKTVVQDYYLSAKVQCNQVSQSGACPDTKIKDGKEDIEFLSFKNVNQLFTVVYKRKLDTKDRKTDLVIDPEIENIMVAAIGPLSPSNDISYHLVKFTPSSLEPLRLNFSREPELNCNLLPNLVDETDKNNLVWEIPELRDVTTFRVQIGASGGTRGYTGITGTQGWGIAWWINELLIPRIHVKRGVTYKFIVEGGRNEENLAEYHPFYITNNKIGGGEQFPNELGSEEHKIYAGIKLLSNGTADVSAAIGRYCEWKHASGVDQAVNSSTFAEYKKTLQLNCSEGNPGQFEWTPDEDTPDVLYYHCFRHRLLGWQIMVGSSFVFTANPVLLLFLFFVSRVIHCLF